ncbi:hypothetical protein Hanom_Chr14g01262521 [Helianthus anomalus]
MRETEEGGSAVATATAVYVGSTTRSAVDGGGGDSGPIFDRLTPICFFCSDNLGFESV